MIDSYSFGRMVIDGQAYTSDLIIYPDHIAHSWWRKSGHKLCVEDIEDVFKLEPEVLVIGTGFAGLMKVDKEVEKYAQSKGMALIVDRTKNAVQKFNEISAKNKTVAAFHLTC